MIPDERRSTLRDIGFDVAAQAFDTPTGPRHYMRRLFEDLSWDHKQRAGRQYSIDLVSGRWTLWGTATWHAWEELCPTASHATPAASVSDHDVLGPFVTECAAAGFDVDPKAHGKPDFGNRFACWNGQVYLLHEQTRQVIDAAFEKHRLEDFLRTDAKIATQKTPGPVFDSASTEEIVEHRPKVVIPQPATMPHSGSHRQPSLF